MSSFSGGEYLVWDVSGNVTFKITKVAGVNAVLSGIFFDANGGLGGVVKNAGVVAGIPNTAPNAPLASTSGQGIAGAGEGGSSSASATSGSVASTADQCSC